MFQYKTVCEVLDDIGATKSQRLILLNKYDKAHENAEENLLKLRTHFPDALCVSAKDQFGFEDLKDRIYGLLLGSVLDYVVPVTQNLLIAELRKAGCIEKEEWLDDGVHLTARATGRLLALLAPYAV